MLGVEHDNLDIELRLKTDHLTISAATGFADQTEQGNNVVFINVRPLIDGVNPLTLMYIICSTCGEYQAHQHMSRCWERNIDISSVISLSAIFSDNSLLVP